MLCTCIRGQMSDTFFSIGGQMSTPVNHLGGKCPCIPFFIGGQMSEGGNVLHSCLPLRALFLVIDLARIQSHFLIASFK